MANLATKAGVEGQGFTIRAPLQNLSKSDIVKAGAALGVDYSLTVSCYQADDQGRACGNATAAACAQRALLPPVSQTRLVIFKVFKKVLNY